MIRRERIWAWLRWTRCDVQTQKNVLKFFQKYKIDNNTVNINMKTIINSRTLVGLRLRHKSVSPLFTPSVTTKRHISCQTNSKEQLLSRQSSVTFHHRAIISPHTHTLNPKPVWMALRRHEKVFKAITIICFIGLTCLWCWMSYSRTIQRGT